MQPSPLSVIYVDVDDTMIRSFGTKRMPMQHVINAVRNLHAQGHVLYCWSSAGADYAKTSAEEVGLGDVFTAFLPKPRILLDDLPPEKWPGYRHVLPGEVSLITA